MTVGPTTRELSLVRPTARIETARALEAGGMLGEQIGVVGRGHVVETGSH